jgi:uncharacterized protein (DUF885 family)
MNSSKPVSGAGTDGRGAGVAAGNAAGPARVPSVIDALADEYADRVIARMPSWQVYLGIEGDSAGLDDYSPDAVDAAAELNAQTRARLEQIESSAAPGAFDEVDAVTADALRERLGLAADMHAAGLDLAPLNNIESATQFIRNTFDLLPKSTADDWESNAARMHSVAGSLRGYAESLRRAVAAGKAPTRRQVASVVEQTDEVTRADGFFDAFIVGAPGAQAGRLRTAADAAKAAYGELAEFLTREILPATAADDACGREDYALYSRQFLGAEVDFEETYAWALDEVERLRAAQQATAEALYPGATVAEAMDRLDREPDRILHGAEELRAWMQGVADESIRAVNGTYFDIPEPLQRIECMVIPNGSGEVYYSGPTDDFSRPGRMWWSVPRGVTDFTTWQEKTTVFHEGVPGHHLQMGGATYNRATLNNWRRNLCWVSGHGEGWALYAEALMAELGFMDEPGDYMGTLDSQMLRATRVVVDLGVHLGLAAPKSVGGGTWDADKAWTYLRAHLATVDTSLWFEWTRYMTWPGQAASYKIGQRIWEQLRADAQGAAVAAGRAFDLKDFHSRALDLGSVGLSTLQKFVG